eukprot:5386012-Alexandrium_andersonii.AAC.1
MGRRRAVWALRPPPPPRGLPPPVPRRVPARGEHAGLGAPARARRRPRHPRVPGPRHALVLLRRAAGRGLWGGPRRGAGPGMDLDDPGRL